MTIAERLVLATVVAGIAVQTAAYIFLLTHSF